MHVIITSCCTRRAANNLLNLAILKPFSGQILFRRNIHCTFILLTYSIDWVSITSDILVTLHCGPNQPHNLHIHHRIIFFRGNLYVIPVNVLYRIDAGSVVTNSLLLIRERPYVSPPLPQQALGGWVKTLTSKSGRRRRVHKNSTAALYAAKNTETNHALRTRSCGSSFIRCFHRSSIHDFSQSL